MIALHVQKGIATRYGIAATKTTASEVFDMVIPPVQWRESPRIIGITHREMAVYAISAVP